MTADTAPETFARIESALAQESREATVHDVKRAVIDEFERVDRRVNIHSTEYFRHSFAPDLVLRWSDDVDRPERWVFLRSKVRPDYLLADVELISRDQPIIFGLAATGEPVSPPERELPEREEVAIATIEPSGLRVHVEVDVPPPDWESVEGELRERTSATGTLVTDPSGLDALSAPPVDGSRDIPDLVARQIIRGGRGVYDRETSVETTSTITAGFKSAFAVDAEPTFKAASTIRERLGENSGGRLLRLLHAIWVGSGGRSDQFPDAPSAAGALSDDALQLLIAGRDIDDLGFWSRVGDFTLPQLGRLNVGDRPANLGRLVSVNADKIEGRWCRVRPDTPRTGNTVALQWGIEQGALALHGSTFTAYLAEEKKDLEGIEPVDGTGITVTELTARATRAEAAISDMTAAGGGLIIGIASETQANVLDNPNAQDGVGLAAENLTKATATLRNRRTILCDFPSTTASSRTRGTLTLRELVRHGLPLVWTLHDDDMSALAEMLPAVTTIEAAAADSAQQTLFDQLDDEADDDEGGTDGTG